jgi:hypothetical protein
MKQSIDIENEEQYICNKGKKFALDLQDIIIYKIIFSIYINKIILNTNPCCKYVTISSNYSRISRNIGILNPPFLVTNPFSI